MQGNKKSWERVCEIPVFRLEGFLAELEDMVKSGKDTLEHCVHMAGHFVDLDNEEPTCFSEEVIYNWIDYMNEQYGSERMVVNG